MVNNMELKIIQTSPVTHPLSSVILDSRDSWPWEEIFNIKAVFEIWVSWLSVLWIQIDFYILLTMPNHLITHILVISVVIFSLDVCLLTVLPVKLLWPISPTQETNLITSYILQVRVALSPIHQNSKNPGSFWGHPSTLSKNPGYSPQSKEAKSCFWMSLRKHTGESARCHSLKKTYYCFWSNTLMHLCAVVLLLFQICLQTLSVLGSHWHVQLLFSKHVLIVPEPVLLGI